MWFAIFFALALAGIASALYLFNRFARFAYVKRLAGESGIKRLLIADGSVIALGLVIWFTLNAMNAVICLLHLVVFWLLCDCVGALVNRIRKKRPEHYIAGRFALAITAAYMCFGWYSAHNIVITEYSLTTDKTAEPLRIVQVSDSHLGSSSTLSAQKFEKCIDEINSLSPDIVVITGDFVDDSTERSQMLMGCEALSRLETTGGVYFVWGNHDSGYSSAEKRGWTAEELKDNLEGNGVAVLEDECISIGNGYTVVGRKDRSQGAQIAESIVGSVDSDEYIIVLDHQPHDYDGLAASGADLVLSGHTHGGQLIPVLSAGELFGVNDATYGLERRRDTDFIVSSGIGCWSLRFKTGCVSEIVVIDVDPTERN